MDLSQRGPFLFWFQCGEKTEKSRIYGDGNLASIVAPNEHCGICLAGNNDSILYIDPINAQMYRMSVEEEGGLLQRAGAVGYNMLGVDTV